MTFRWDVPIDSCVQATRFSDFVRAATVTAKAYGGKRWRVISIWLLMFAGVVVFPPFGRTYLSESRDSSVTVRRGGAWQLLGTLLTLVILLAVVLTASVLANIFVPPLARALEGIGLVAACWVLLGALVVLSGRAGRCQSFRDTGSETPRGRRYLITGLAQLPGTRYSGLYLARDVLNALPSGSVVCAVAATEKLQRLYVLGAHFTAGKQLRVFRVID